MRVAWNKGLTKETDERVKNNSEARAGFHHTEEAKKKISDANKGLDSLARQAHIADASVAHAVANFADTDDGLDALGDTINSILSALETALILNTS